MNERKQSSKLLVTVTALAVIVLAIWFGGGFLWRMLLAMHGVH